MAKTNHIQSWNKIAKNYSKRIGIYQEQIKILAKYLNEDGTVIDIGCGPGYHLAYLAKKGLFVTGIDISTKMVNLARERLKKSGLNGKVSLQDATKLKFKDKSFDYTVSMNNTIGVIPTEKARKKALKEMIRVTKKKAIIELLKSNDLEEKERFIFKDKDNKLLGYPACRFNEDSIKDFFKDYNIHIEKTRPSKKGEYFFSVIVNLEK